MKPRLLLSSLFLVPVLASSAFAENEIGFIERFALAADREKVLGELVPGSEDYYFYHALHYQNTRNTTKYADILAQWKKRFPDEVEQRRVIENREALLTYDVSPQATLAYLKEQLGIEHHHEQEARDQKPNLPTTLDPQRIARNLFLVDSLANEGSLDGLSQEALAALIRDKITLPPHQRRALLNKLERPDVPGLVEFIAQDLQTKESRGFGEFEIHGALLPAQLDQLATLVPEVTRKEVFVYTKVRKMAPSDDVNMEYDEAEREAWLTRVWDYAKGLPPSFNTLKSRILYLRLDHDRKRGVYDRERFMEYLKLPRTVAYAPQRFIEQASREGIQSNLHVDLSEALISAPPIGNDEPLVKEYFLQLCPKEPQAQTNPEAAMGVFTEYVQESWLKPIFAEALIVSSATNAERWASLITPTEFQKLKDRVDIDFPATNSQFLLPGDDVQFDVIVKNTPKLIVKIFELNTLNYFQTQRRQLNTDLNLDGLVANSEQTYTFEGGPFVRTRQNFKFPELKGRRGAWIIEFIGGGRSSRALVRVGQWQVLQQTGPAGDLLLVLDEKREPLKDAVAWVDGRKLKVDEKLGRIVVPFTLQPGTKPLVIGDAAGTFATLTQFDHHGEDYQLDAQFHVDREQLLARREATLAMRVALLLGSTHLGPELLSEPRLTITSTSQDGIATTQEVKDLKLSAGSVFTHKLTIPERLASLTATFSAKVEVLSNGGEKRDLTATHTWNVNGMDATQAVSDGHLSRFGNSYVFELLGKNGEPVADQQVVFTFKHKEFSRELTIQLRTDEQGRVQLGELGEIEQVSAQCPNGRSGRWTTMDETRTFNSLLHAKAGETVRIPVSSKAAKASLLSLRAGSFASDVSGSINQRDSFLMIEGLTPGDYSLRVAGETRSTMIKVADGQPLGGWVLGKHRQLEVKDTAPLQITGLETDNEFITVKLANSSPFARVHMAATRFLPSNSIFEGLSGFSRFSAAEGAPAKMPNLYSQGREIGDEYRYILERRYTKIYPGNMLTRPGLLLNPWETRDTGLDELAQNAGQAAGMTRGGRDEESRVGVEQKAKKSAAELLQAAAETNIDFLALSAPVIWNLIPDTDGIVRIERKALGDRQQVQIYVEDLQNAAWRTFALPEVKTQFADQRLARSLDPAKSFTQHKEVTVLEQGKSLTMADILTSELETYDTLSSVYSLFTTLNSDENLAKFAFVLQWPKLTDAEKKSKYGEYACHELNFFLAKKDKAFFDTVIKPYLANKKDKTFMDEFLLGQDLSKYLEPWAYAQLNVAERCLLAQRIEGEAPNAARHLRELWQMIPPNPEEQDRLFETALRGRVMEAQNSGFSVSGTLEEGKLDAAAKDRLAGKLRNIIFPQVQFQAASVEEAVEMLRIKSHDYDTTETDPARRGVNVVVKPGAAPSSAQITLDLKDVPLSEALKYVTELGGMKYKIEPHAVVIVPISDVSSEQYTRSFKVPQAFGQTLAANPSGTAKELLERYGIPFPEGASATFAPATSQLMVKNTAPNLDQVEAFVQEIQNGRGMPAFSTAPADPFAPAPPAANHFAIPQTAAAPVMAVAPKPAPPASAKRMRSMTSDEASTMSTKSEAEAISGGLGDARTLSMQREGVLNGIVTLSGGAGVVSGNKLDLDGTISLGVYGGGVNFFGNTPAQESRAAYRSLFRSMGPTKEWAENNYYQVRIADQNAELITVNAFWRDYAAWLAAGAKGGFVSANVAEAHRNFAEMMLALAVLDLPFEAAKHVTKTEGSQFTLTASGPVIGFHKQIQSSPQGDGAQGQLLVSQSFFRDGDRYRQEENEKFEKYVTDEFLTGVVFGANVVVTNPTSAPVKAEVLLQIPQGALPVKGSKVTDSRQIRIESYMTQTFEYYFYFPATPAQGGAKFPHYPVSLATKNGAASAKPFEFHVVSKLTQVDKASWDYVSQYGSEAEVFSFLEQSNLESLDMERVAWRCRKSVDFYKKLTTLLRTHHVWDEAICSYALLHNDAASLREWLKHQDSFIEQCGPYLATKLITIDPIERRAYEHLEYSPLVNQRAHRLGGEWRIANPAVLEEYESFLGVLASKPQLDAVDNMSVVYFLFLQDRVEEALPRFKNVDAAALPTKVQHDYFTCYADFYDNDLAGARAVAAKYADFPVPRWKTLFADVTAQLDEIEGKAAKPLEGSKPDREKQQSQLASTEPGFEFKVENKTISLAWSNLKEVTLNFYLMDPEFSFSSSPFMSKDASRFSIIKPSKTVIQALPVGQSTLEVPLPPEYAKANVLVEAIGAGLRKAQAYHANTLKLALAENYGRLEARDSTTDGPLPKAYVKVYAKLSDGTVRFYKDGYTDLRGRFDYASLNGPAKADSQVMPYEHPTPGPSGLDYQMLKPAELDRVEKLSILVLSDTHGATVKEVSPPRS